MMRFGVALLCLLMALPLLSEGQRRRRDLGTADATGWGFRIATDIQKLSGGADGLQYLPGSYSNLVLGAHYRRLNRFGGYELGLNLLYKGEDMDLPVVAQAENDAPVGILGGELQLLAGPRFLDYFFPRIGVQAGYRSFQNLTALYDNNTGTPVLVDATQWYARVPLGLQLEFPTVWGGVGAGAFYQVALTNAFQNPGGVSNWQGGAANSWRFEVSVRFDKR